MHVATSGPKDGRTVLFLHGSLVGGWMWAQQAEDLGEYRCLIPDLPGFDHSGTQRWVSLSDTADQVADIVRAETREAPADVVGLSLGGLVGLHLAVRHPCAVRSLLVSGVPLGAITWPVRTANRVLTRLYHRPRGAEIVARAFGMPDEESRQAFVEGAARTDPEALTRISAELAAGPLPDLTSLHTPLLAVVGSKDSALARRFVQNLPALVPGATAGVVPDVGHQWNAEQPTLFSELVRAWIKGDDVLPGVNLLDRERT